MIRPSPALLTCLLLACAHAKPQPGSLDLALGELAAGRIDAARNQLAGLEGVEARCWLGVAERRAGRNQAAATLLAQVPADAPCGTWASFERAEALAALGRAPEALALMSALGRPALGPDRDRWTAELLAEAAQRLQQRDRSAPAQELLKLGLSLTLGPATRRALAEQLAALELASRPATATAALALAAGPLGPAELARIARLLPPGDGARLARSLEGPSGALTRAQILLELDPLAGTVAAEAHPSLAVARALALAQRQDAAGLPALDALWARADLPEADARAASAARADLRAAHGQLAEAAAALGAHLDRFPGDRARRQARPNRVDHLLRAAYAAFAADELPLALEHADAAAAQSTGAEHADATWLAALASLRGPDPQAGRQRLARLAAGSHRALEALTLDTRIAAASLGGPAALAALKASGHPQANAAHEILTEERLWISAARQPPGAEASVSLHATGAERCEIRLHPIDAEAFVRAGGTPEGLAELDVAVVAPARSFEQPLTQRPDLTPQTTSVSLGRLAPGIWRVTAATRTRAATSVLMISSLDLVAQRFGDTLVAAVFREGRPVKGARILARGEGAEAEATTDAGGLARLTLAAWPATVLARQGGEVALLQLTAPAGPRPAPPGVQVAVDLDRPHYGPGDPIGIRLVARKDGAPYQGPIRLWLATHDQPLAPRRLTTDARGLALTELRAPLAGAPTLWAAVGDAPPTEVMRLSVGAAPPAARRLDLELGDQPTATLSEPWGAPVADALLTLRGPLLPDGLRARTDAHGRLTLPAPPPGLPWSLEADLGSELSAQATRQAPPKASYRLAVHPTQARAGEPVQVRLHGPAGPSFLRVEALARPRPIDPRAPDDPDPDAIVLPPAPGALELPPPQGPRKIPRSRLVSTGARTAVDADRPLQIPPEGPAHLALSALPPGRYALWAYDLDGRARQAQPTPLEILPADLAFSLLGAQDAVPGDTLTLSARGAPAVITAAVDGRLLAAHTAADGAPIRLPITPAWAGTVTLLAVAADGRTARETLEVDARLHVSLSLDEGPPWRLTGTVRDARGRPVQGASLALAIHDAGLLAHKGQPARSAALLDPPPEAPTDDACVFGHRHSAEDAPLAGALIAEAARIEERARAAAARAGRFSQGRVAELEAEDLLDDGEFGVGGLGGFGRGGGGGGYGRGAGVRSQIGRIKRLDQAQIHRDRILWAVGDTDPEGRFSASLPRPPVAAPLIARGLALTATQRGELRQPLAVKRPWIQPLAPGAAGPQDRALVTAVVHNPGPPAALTLSLIPDPKHSISKEKQETTARSFDLPAGGRAQLELGGPQAPGSAWILRLSAGDTVLHELPWRLPLSGAPDPHQALLEIAADAGGGLPLATLALGDAAAEDPRRQAARGLAALAARPHAHPAHHPALDAALDATWRHVVAARAFHDPLVIRFAAEATVQLDLPPKRAAGWAEALRPGPSVDARLEWLEARAAAALPLPPEALERLRRGPVEGPQRGRLARLLVRAGQAEAARPLSDGADPQGVLARRALRTPGAEAPFTGPPPPEGAGGLDAWITAAAAAPGRATGPADLRLGDRIVGRLDRDQGGRRWIPLPADAPLPAPTLGGAPVFHRRLAPVPAPEGPGPERIPRFLSGGILATPARPEPAEEARCGDAAAPCALALGDALRVQGDLFSPGWQPPAGLARERTPSGWLLRAVAPAQGVLVPPPAPDRARSEGTVRYTIHPRLDGPGALDPQSAYPLARDAVDQGTDASAYLALLRGVDTLAASAAPLTLIDALARGQGGPALVDALTAARELAPDTALNFEQLTQLADALAAAGHPERALSVWRAALGAAFLSQAAGVRRAEAHLGQLATLKALSRLARRFPDVEPVAEALFLLPQRLDAILANPLSDTFAGQGITPTDLRLLSAQWDQEWLARRPEDPRAAEAGLHLVRTLLHLDAPAQAARWAKTLAAAHADGPQQDGLLYLEGLARARLGEGAAALRLFERIAREDFPNAEGSRGPAESRQDARYAAARVYEALGRTAEARAAYAEAADDQPEAETAAAALSRIRLSAPPRLATASDRVTWTLEASNLPTLNLRAYPIDLKTLFLRDGHLREAHALRIAGVSPTWTRSQAGHSGPYPKALPLKLPLPRPGAWLLVADGPGAEATSSLVLRSRLQLHEEPTLEGDVRLRVTDPRGRPVAGAEARIAGDGGITADRTDVRGILTVPTHTPVLIIDGPHYAFSAAAVAPPLPEYTNARRASRILNAAPIDLERNIDARLKEQVERNAEGYDSLLQTEQDAALPLKSF